MQDIKRHNLWRKNCDSATVDEWLKLSKKLPGDRCKAMESLFDLIGLAEVKKIALQVFATTLAQSKTPNSFNAIQTGSLNYTFVGNPGTGKTTVARIFADLLQQAGARNGNRFIQLTASEAIRKGEKAFATELASLTGGKRDNVPPAENILRKGMDVEVIGNNSKWYPAKVTSVNKTENNYVVEYTGDGSTDDDIPRNRIRALISKTDIGGILFLDEAYDLNPKSSSTGAAILNDIMNAAEEHRDKLTIILAGYQDEIEKNLYEFNSGMPSRFQNVIFMDFSHDQLAGIWRGMCEQKWECSEEITQVATRRVAHGIGSKGFGNARSVRSLYETAVKEACLRLHRTGSKSYKFVVQDIIGPEPTVENLPDLRCALDELHNMVGINSVKKAIDNIVTLALANYHNELRGEPIDHFALNRLFFGNPGTGKTTVAKIYGRVLKSLRLLPKSDVVYKTASDFKGEHIGSSQERSKAILKMSEEKVLLIDEAYVLDDEMYGKEALNVIVEKVTGAPGEKRAVIMCGYKDPMLKMIREQNAGLSSRFNRHNALEFENFNSLELQQVFTQGIKRERLSASYAVEQRAIAALVRASNLQNFGNARTVNTLISDAKQRLRARHRDPSYRELSEEDVDPGRPKFSEAANFMNDLEDIPIKDWLENIGVVQQVRHDEGESTSGIVSNLLFTGPPGTGKTTVARRIGKILHAYGLLSSEIVVETSGSKVVGQYVGQTENNVRKFMEEAQGGVLFIDEAYQMVNKQSYGTNAISTLLGMVTEEPHKDGKTVVILAGYKQEMDLLLDTNPGLRGRFPEEICFSDWSINQCCNLISTLAQKDSFEVNETVEAVLRAGFRDLRELPGWSNARDVESVYKKLRKVRDIREFKERSGMRVITQEDANFAMEHFKQSRNESRSLPQSNDKFHSATLTEFAVTEPVNSRPQHLHSSTPPRHAFSSVSASQCTSPSQAAANPKIQSSVQVHSELNSNTETKKDAVFKLDEKHDRAEQEEEEQLDAEHESARQVEEERLRKLKIGEEEEERKLKILRIQLEKQKEEEENERKRKEIEELIRQRENKLKQMREKEKRRQQIVRTLRSIGRCPVGFDWIYQGDYFRCAGGSHYVSYSDLMRNGGFTWEEVQAALS